MELSWRFVGTPTKDYHTEITWRQTMNFAAALDDNNACYVDDEREGGIIAPPIFGVAVTWRILERIWEYIEAKDFPAEILLTQVHHTEHLAFHRPLRPGERLTVKGGIAAILPHRAGTRVVMRFEALNEAHEPVFTEHIGALLRGVKCSDEGSCPNRLPGHDIYWARQLIARPSRRPGRGASYRRNSLRPVLTTLKCCIIIQQNSVIAAEKEEA